MPGPLQAARRARGTRASRPAWTSRGRQRPTTSR